MLQLRGFVPTLEKVKEVTFHPVQPWIAFADKGDSVKVWDWSTQQILHDISLGGADDEGAVESAINRGGERDGSFATNASAASYAPSRVSSGKVRQVRFLDSEVAYYQTASSNLMVNGVLSGPLPRASDAHALDGTRLMVVVCDAKVVLYDLASKKPFEVTKSQLEGKAPTCISFLFCGGSHAAGGGGADGAPEGAAAAAAPAGGMMASPLLAVGCADGAVRLVHLATLKMVGRLVPSGRSKFGAITAIMTLPSRQGGKTDAAAQGGKAADTKQSATPAPPGGAPPPPVRGKHVAPHDLVVAADSVGAVLLWDPFGRGPLTSRDVAPARAVDAHSGEVWSLCLAPGPEDDTDTSPRLFSCGADKLVAAWDPHTLKEMWRTKMDSKAPATSLSYSHRYFNLSGAHGLLMTVNGSTVMAMYTLLPLPLDRGLRPCIDLGPLIPPGQKKVAKVYTVAVSPMRPNLAAVGANSGMAFLTFDRMYPLPVVALPPRDLASCHVSPSRAVGPGPVHISYVAHLGSALWHVSCAAVVEGTGAGGPCTAPVVVSKEPIAGAANHTGRAILGASPSGDYVSCVWPASRQYLVLYHTLAGTWQEVDAGTGVDLAWHSHRDQFAIMEEPPPMAPLVARSKGLLKNKEKEAQKAAAAAAEAAAVAALNTVVRIKSLDGLEARVTCQKVALGHDVPIGVHGGPLLGVAYKRLTTVGSELSGEQSSAVLQLWSWDGNAKFGPELPEPNFVRWDPTTHMVAMGYLRQVQLFRARPRFEPIGAIPVAGATGAAWALRQLYLSTPTGIHVAFVAAGESRGPAGRALMDLGGGGGPGEGPAEPAVALVSLAAISGSDATSTLSADGGAGGGGAALPAPRARPPGPVALLGPREGNVWLVNMFGQPTVLPMDHPGLRARCLAAMGDVLGAVQVAAAGLSPQHHDGFASFLSTMAGPEGAQVALLGLHGLSLDMEAELCMATGQWRRALACCDALLHGCADRGHLRFAANATARRYAQATEPAAAAAAGVAAGAATALARGPSAAAAAAVAAVITAEGFELPEDPPPPTKAATNQAMWGYMGFGGLFVDNFSMPTEEAEKAQKKARDPVARGKVDWGAPLQGGWAYKKGGGGKAGAAAQAGKQGPAAGFAAGTPAPGALQPPASALRLAMRLVEGSHEAGITDVTAAAAQLLLEHRGCLQPAQLARLAARMAEIGMNADVKLLVDSGVGSGSHNGQAVGFVAAALTGDLERLQSALQASGTIALAALQANTYRLPQSLDTTNKWNEALKATSIAAGAQAYLTVMPSGL